MLSSNEPATLLFGTKGTQDVCPDWGLALHHPHQPALWLLWVNRSLSDQTWKSVFLSAILTH